MGDRGIHNVSSGSIGAGRVMGQATGRGTDPDTDRAMGRAGIRPRGRGTVMVGTHRHGLATTTAGVHPHGQTTDRVVIVRHRRVLVEAAAIAHHRRVLVEVAAIAHHLEQVAVIIARRKGAVVEGSVHRRARTMVAVSAIEFRGLQRCCAS